MKRSMVLFLFVGAIGYSQAVTIMGKPVIAQVPSPLSIEVRPGVDVPLGDSASWFTAGGAMDLGLTYRFPGTIFTISGGIHYAYVPVQASTSLSVAAVIAGGGVQLPIAEGIAAFASAAGGCYVGSYNDFSKQAVDPWISGGLGLKFTLAPTFNIKIGAQYKNFLGLYQGISAGVGAEISLGNLGGSVELPSVQLLPAFPVFYKHYDDHPIGSLQLKSTLKVPATNLRAQVFVKEYMDSPKTVEVPGALAPGESRNVDLYALFNDKVLDITEGTKVAAEITVSYRVEGRTYEDRKIETLTLWGRNAMTWDDDRKAAAYVTAKDPGVLAFARGVASNITGQETRSICDNLQAAIAFHEAINAFGINYSTNPQTPYAEVSKNKLAIDFLQFPRETFQYKAGDCSDLSILYAALFQAVGIDAAFITVPGHIFIAFDSNLTPAQAPKELIPEGQFIAYKNKAWIPVEVTSIHEGFCRAWDLGAREWADNQQSGQAAFYTVKEAWNVYQPVGLPGTGVAPAPPQPGTVLTAYQAEAKKYLDAALAPMVAELQEKSQGGANLAAMNSLGVLYAKYGQGDMAERQFKAVLAKSPYVPSILNLGHLYYQQGNWKSARDLYQRARDTDPGNTHALLALARVDRELQDYADAKASYDMLKAADPALAGEYSFLGEGKEGGARAADAAAEKRKMLWEMTD